MIALNSNISSKQLPTPSGLEVVTAEISCNTTVTLCVIYIPPNSDSSYHHYMLTYLSTIASKPHTLILGDFNYPDINWYSLVGQSNVSNAFCDFVYKYNLSQLVKFPTHIKGNTLDLVLTTSPHLVSNPSHCDLSSYNGLNSDHFLLSFALHISNTISRPKANGSKFVPKHSYKMDYEGLTTYLFDYDFSFFYEGDDIETLWLSLKEIVLHSMSRFSSRSRPTHTKGPAWFNSDIRHSLNKLHSLRKRFKRPNLPSTCNKLSVAEASLQSKMLDARSKYESTLVSDFACSKNSKIYSYIKSFSKHMDLPPTVFLESAQAATPAGKAALFNDFFHSVFNTKSPLPSITNLHLPDKLLCSITFTDLETYEALSSIDSSKASGVDGIPSKVWKCTAIALYKPVHHLFSLCLKKSYIPREWRTHQITPILKRNGDKTSVTSYRPISLLSCISKVLEKLIFDKTSDFLVSNIVSSSQFGFVRKRSTLQQLLTFMSSVIHAFDNKTQVDVNYLDIKKAFDSVSHSELLARLWSAGLVGSAWKFFKAYLNDRQQFVSIQGHSSKLLPVTSGVPQGSILGPMLFIIYINNLPDILEFATCLLFADDTKLLRNISSITNSTQLQNDINHLLTWSLMSHLTFNLSKTLMLRFPNRSTNIDATYFMDSSPIQVVESCKDLGVIVSSDLSWSLQQNSVISKAYRQLGLIRRTFSKFVSVREKKLLYLSLVRSQLTYCSQLWRPQFIKDIAALEKVQRRATKYILNDYTSDYKQRLITLGMLPLMHYYEYLDISFLATCLKEPNSSFPILDYITFSSSNTRSRTFAKLVPNKVKSNVSRHFYFNRVTRLWNLLPPIDLDLPLASIKRKLKEVLWEHFKSNFSPSNYCTFHLLCPCNNCQLTPSSSSFQLTKAAASS